ncbi:MAG: class I SAM-dependent methyltransferase [Flavobacteriales bacterium]
MSLKQTLLRLQPLKYYFKGKLVSNDATHQRVIKLASLERSKRPSRTEIINFILSLKSGHTSYLEIGVCDPTKNFDKIIASEKYSVDPGVEFESNPVDFKLTSDDFFDKLSRGEILSSSHRFDAIFIDGLHIAEQVDRDIQNALKFLQEDGFVILHDCNPPSEWHAREQYEYRLSPAGNLWNGTCWKAFVKWRSNPSVQSCCIDTDWGVGVLSKKFPIGAPLKERNEFFEFSHLNERRKEQLNLLDFDTFKKILQS